MNWIRTKPHTQKSLTWSTSEKTFDSTKNIFWYRSLSLSVECFLVGAVKARVWWKYGDLWVWSLKLVCRYYPSIFVVLRVRSCLKKKFKRARVQNGSNKRTANKMRQNQNINSYFLLHFTENQMTNENNKTKLGISYDGNSLFIERIASTFMVR